MFIRFVLIVIVTAALAAPAGALIIDDFATGGTTLSLADTDINTFALETTLGGPTIYKDRRYTQLDWQPAANGNIGDSASVAVNSAGSGVATLTKVGDPRLWFGYGERAFDLTWDEDFSSAATSRLKITFGPGGAPDTIDMFFYVHGLIGGVPKLINDNILFAPGQVVGYFDLVGTANAQGVDADLLRQHVTGLAVYYVGQNNSDTAGSFTLERIELVPEPATMGMLAVGALALLRRRRGHDG
jgi:hypothetical protein